MLKLKKEQSQPERENFNSGAAGSVLHTTEVAAPAGSASSRFGVRRFNADPRVNRRSASLSSVVEDQDQAPESCLFADERIRVFYAEIKSLINDCFHSLRDTVLNRYPDPAEQQKRYAKGLLFVAYQMNSTANCSEIHRVKNTFPRIADNYQRAMSRFAQYVIPQRYLHVGNIKCPSLESFLYELYRRVALSTEIKSMQYFYMNYLEQEIFLKDILRISMSSCLESRNARNDEHQEDAPALMMLEDGGCANAPDYVMPQDSVSNIHATHQTGYARTPVAGPAQPPPAVPGQPVPTMPVPASKVKKAQARQCDPSVVLSAVSAVSAGNGQSSNHSSDSDESLSVFLRSHQAKQRHSRVKNKNLSGRQCNPNVSAHDPTPPTPPTHPELEHAHAPARSPTAGKKASQAVPPSAPPLQSPSRAVTTSLANGSLANGSRTGDNIKEIDLEIYSTPFNAVSSRRLKHGSQSVASARSTVSVRSSTSARTQVTDTGSQTMNGPDSRPPSSTIKISQGDGHNPSIYRREAWSQFGNILESDQSGATSGEDEDIETSHTSGGRPCRRRVSSQPAGPKSHAASQQADDEFVFFKESVLQWKSGQAHPQIPPSEIVF